MAEWRPWETREGEPRRAHLAFEVYRSLGLERTLTKAVRQWLAADEERGGRPRQRQARRFRTHARPRGYLRALRNQWRRWAAQWEWEERCRVWDEVREAEVKQEADRAAAEAALAEAEENQRQRHLCLEEARRMRALGRQVLDQVEERIAAGELEEMSLSELLPHLQAMGELLEVGQRMELGLELERRLAQLERALHLGEGR
jgi:hypothetical protein